MNSKALTTRIIALGGWAMLASLGLLGIAAAAAQVSQQIEPATIALGQAAQLTVTASGDSAQVTAPMVAGLEFVAVGQAQRIESINGVTRSTNSVTYQVTAQQPGIYTIPGTTNGSEPLVLTVTPGGSGNPSAPHAGGASPPAGGATRLNTDGSAFVRLRLATHDLYVGETVPIDIQVGVLNGIVASLNGLPTLNGDAFTLNKLSTEPQRSAEIIDGKPFTVFTWRSALAAVKPGALSLTMSTPLTVRIRTARPEGAFGNAALDDLFDDPAFQNFFGGVTEREVTVQSQPASFTVMPLPVDGRPADFSGAVGHFAISSALSESAATLGDPLTLSLRVSGTGNFDRVNSAMLHDVPDWKTYAPTAAFKADDDIGYRGEKTFQQPLIATRSGPQAIPELSFSWFDPTTKRYETAHTSALSASIAPAPAGSRPDVASTASPVQSTPSAQSTAAGTDAGTGLRADHVDDGQGVQSLVPDYYRPAYVAAPSALLVAFLGAWVWVRRREQTAATGNLPGPLKLEPYLKLMDEAGAANDAELFFKVARAALQLAFAPQWHMKPGSITEQDIEQRLGADHDVSRLFKLADATAYSGTRLNSVDFARWKSLVRRQLNIEALS
jgi:hypothetical protein